MQAFSNLVVVDHPLVRHKLALLRDRDAPPKRVRELIAETTLLVGGEATRDLAVEAVRVETPLEPTDAHVLAGEPPALVPVLRAGLAMVDPMLRLLPTAAVGHVGVQRDPETLEPVHYYFKIPPAPERRDFLVLDPMLATGGSADAAIERLRAAGARTVRVLCIVAAPEGVARIGKRHPDLRIFTAALDRMLDEHGYIRPGIGDAGDRLYDTR